MTERTTTVAAVLLALPLAACGPAELEPPAAPTHPRPAAMDLHLDVQKRTVAAVSAAMNAHDAERYAALFAADATIHEYGLGDAGGRAAIARGLQRALDGFPDLAVGVGDVFASEDVVVLEWVITGTNRGELNGANPTGKPIGVRVASAFVVRRPHRDRAPLLGHQHLVAQLGLLSVPARRVAAVPSGEPRWHVARGTAEEAARVDVREAIAAALAARSEADFLGALAKSVTWSSVTLPEDSTGRASASELLATLTTTFPDVRLASVAQFGVDDVVVSEWTVTATGRSTTLHGLDIAVVKDGRVVSGASYANRFEMSGEERVCREPSPGR